MDEMTMDSRPIGNPAYAIREDGSGWTEMINLDVAAGVTLNQTGMIVWRAVNGKRTVAEIIAKVKDRFPDASASSGEDVLTILRTLREAGLIGFELEV